MSLANLKIGDDSPSGDEIEAIYSAHKEFIIFRTGDRLKVYIDDDHLEPEDRVLHQRYMQVAPLIADAYSLMPNGLWNNESINRQLARGFSVALSGQIDESSEIITSVILRLRARYVLLGRTQYHLGAFLGLCASLLAYGIMLLVLCDLNQITKTGIETIVFGALGAYLSVAIGIKNIETDPESGLLLNGFAGATRLSIGMVAAVFAYVAVSSGFILAPLRDGSSPLVFLTVGFVSGFSERFVPNALAGISDRSSTS
ncbi:hypothetical protein [Hirschia maritima]|uniref:hypothetical protein n=1 Tax=Hirschia maritima TaxID=1121961 RepID=UPI000377318C|nr:hypothetical protein [Hirschia maritima]